MMLKKKKLGKLDIILIAVLAVSLVLAISFIQSSAAAAGKKGELEIELAATKIRLAQMEQAADIEELEQTLASLKKQAAAITASASNLPREEDCVGIPALLWEWSEQNEVEITSYSSAWTSELVGEMEYPVFRAIVLSRGKPSDLAGFLESITSSEFSTVVIDELTMDRGEENWALSIGIRLYTRPESEGLSQ